MNEVQNKKNYTLKVVLITLLVVLLVGCISFIVYEKFIKKENSNPTVTDKDKNNEATDIKYNEEMEELISRYKGAIEKNAIYGGLDILDFALDSTNKYQYNYKMYFTDNSLVELALKYQKENNTSEVKISKEEMKKQFISLFGPETEYKDGSFYISESGTGYNTDVYENGMYVNLTPGGYDSPIVYKVEYCRDEKKDNIISIYWYSYEFDELKNEITSHGKTIATTTESTFENDVNNLKKEGKISLYKINFKKQSDGRYYLYSGEWQ